ncbi:MAG: cyclic pyranopterin monophosphate synthase MoaC [Vulcanimicrobiota bacterium]
MSDLTHLDDRGQARMVDVGAKPQSQRRALASAQVTMAAATFELVCQGQAPKGDVEAVARVAAIMAAKKTAELIPLCHPLPLDAVEVEFVRHPPDRLEVQVEARCRASTGVEMEALTAASVAALTLVDMLKGVDKTLVIGPVRLLEKEGGRSGHFRAEL